MKMLKNFLSFILIVLMMSTSIPVTNIDGSFLGITAHSAGYKAGNIIEFGSYPQSEVTDSKLTAILDDLSPLWDEWTNYGYYSGDGAVGSMVEGDWMRYWDVEYNGSRYRGVKFKQYRPYYTYKTSSVTYQDDNGYDIDTVYWFKFEPIKWRVLDPGTGLVMCETIIDSQPYCNTIYSVDNGIYGCFNDTECTAYACDYETSYIREWLNSDFYYIAFTEEERERIGSTTLNNNGYYTSVGTKEFEKLDGNHTNDKVFLLSYDDLKNDNFEFDSSSVKFDVSRMSSGSDYAKIQGLYVYDDSDSSYDGNSFWTLRTPGTISYYTCYVTHQGCSRSFYGVDYAGGGIRPAFCFGWGEAGNNPDDLSGGTGKYKREHVVKDWFSLNKSFASKYLGCNAVPMDGTNGNPDYLIPGQTQDMIPQGLAYWPEKDWVLVSSYDKSEQNPSVIFALDRKTGEFVAQFNLKEKIEGEVVDWKPHAGGIGISDNNLYITEDSGVSYFPLSDLDITGGSVKNIVRKDHIDFGQLGKACADYVSVSDGMLWAGNFYTSYLYGGPLETLLEAFKILPPAWDTPASSDYNSLVLGFKLTGSSSESEWNNLKSIKNSATHRIGIHKDLQCIQGVAFKKIGDKSYRMYLSRTTDISFGAEISCAVVNLDSNKIDIKENKFKRFKNLPGTEGITFIGDDLHILYESGALSGYDDFVNNITWSETLKDCTDVIWKVDEKNLLYASDFKDGWFENGAYSGYNHELAQFCAEMVMLGYEYNDEIVSEGLEKFGLTTRSVNMQTERDEVNYFIADRNIQVKGKDKNLIVLGCIGSYRDQWYSNFDPLGYNRKKIYAGDSEKYYNHIGFADAREYVYGKLNEYIRDNNIDKSNSIILLTGHSRGSATVNLLAAKLIDDHLTYGISVSDIYTYGFATPKTTSNTNSEAEEYKSIINIVNPEDFVTKVLPTAWGYSRYGITYTLPSKNNDKNYHIYLKKMRKIFKEYNGETYDPYKLGELKTYNMVEDFVSNIGSLNEFYNKKFIGSYTQSEEYVYSSTYDFFKRTLLLYLATDQEDKSGIVQALMHRDLIYYLGILCYFAWPDLKVDEVIEALMSDMKIFDGVAVGGKFSHAHSMYTYSAYIHSMTAEEVMDERKGYKGTVNCPVDIEIYDKETGEIVGRIVDNIVDEEIAEKDNSVVMYVNGDSKTFCLPSNGAYEIRLIGNDEGSMDYTMSEIDSDIGEIKRVNFFDVEITDGLTMSADVDGGEFVIEEHEFLYENGEILEATEVFDEEVITTHNIEITSTDGGSVSSSQKVKSGDYVNLEAYAAEGYKFIGWYENDILLSDETTFAFVVKCNRNLEAKFEHFDHNYGEWYVATPSTCEVVGSERHDCAECDYFEIRNIPLSEHKYVQVIIPPTCTEKGYTTNTCSVCGESFTSDIIVATEHSLGNWYELIPSTCKTVGKKQRDCSACDYYETRDIPLSDHKFNEWHESLPSKCEVAGIEQRDCMVCDCFETRKTPASGHEFVGSACTKCGFNKADNCDCNCHAGGIKGFFFSIALFFQKIFKSNQICKCGAYHY